MARCRCCYSTFLKNALQSPRKNVIGHRIRVARLCLKPRVTQEDLAGRMAAQGIELNRSAISKIESGVRQVVDYEIKCFAKCLKVKPGWFFED